MTPALVLSATIVGFTTTAFSAPICGGGGCAADLVSKGWKEIGRCEGHAWSVLLAKDEKMIVCNGISTRGGPNGWCEDFSGDPGQYRNRTANSTPDGRNCWGWADSSPSRGRGK